ncbi:hypothetical protein EVAR_77283_1 [Eumeta japonica]|uniref:Uncharacterized protein n=1 Tax=Eumeta variegata TaxID=151549 RepID=A0A4C1ULR8_EUMVA|nr:hypothetical protein EVAR_77283_1 [Eumeta japonica]
MEQMGVPRSRAAARGGAPRPLSAAGRRACFKLAPPRLCSTTYTAATRHALSTLVASTSRQHVYAPESHWYGKPIDQFKLSRYLRASGPQYGASAVTVLVTAGHGSEQLALGQAHRSEIKKIVGSSRVGCVQPLSLFYSDASADGVEEKSLVPRSRSRARLRRNATMSHAFLCVQPAFIDLKNVITSIFDICYIYGLHAQRG